jgi:hypothetical protein
MSQSRVFSFHTMNSEPGADACAMLRRFLPARVKFAASDAGVSGEWAGNPNPDVNVSETVTLHGCNLDMIPVCGIKFSKI